jgi:outer membrane protein OmpA-like peptidoglycan-associated protein
MKSNNLRLLILVLCASFTFIGTAQNTDDLGSTKPFLIGLKGTIYNYVLPIMGGRYNTVSMDSVGYTKEIEKTPPIGYVYAQSLNISERELSVPFPGVPRGKNTFAIVYTGNFEVKDSAEYAFGLKSDDGSRLWIDGQQVINNDGIHQFNIAKTGSIGLSKGFHTIKVWYFQGLATRMGLLLVMKKSTEKDFRLFDLKKYEAEIQKSIGNQQDTTTIRTLGDNKVLFETGKYELKTESSDWLMSIARILIFNPQAKVRIEGHTDNVGSAASNQTLSENRAKAVEDALKKLNVLPSVTFNIKGLGLTQPLAPNDSEEGRAKNRRVEVFIEK